MFRNWFSFGLSLLCLAQPAAAVVEQKRVEIRLAADGHYQEETWLEVRLEHRSEAESWAYVPIALDDNRQLEMAAGSILAADGSRRRIEPADSDTLDWSPEGVTHSSSRFRLLDFSAAEVGETLSIHYRVRVAPYFPSGASVLGESSDIERLSVDLGCASSRCRWALHGPAAALDSAETEWGVHLEGSLAGGSREPTLLRFGWGEQGSWSEVASWYAGLVADLPASQEARDEAVVITTDVASPRDRLAVLVGNVRRSVRYVAVEVGVGGFRPTPPAEVAARRWGDCKDKAFLLLDQLAAVGVAAHPALILSADDRRLEQDFPSPDQFNHLIVAVEESAVEGREGDPSAGGYLFVDPTLSAGGLRWLHPSTQGQLALVVHPDGGELVATPVLPEQDVRRLEAVLTIDTAGSAHGTLALHVVGARAQSLIAAAAQDGGEETARAELRRWLPSAELSDLAWGTGPPGGVPSLAVSAKVVLAGWLQAGASSLRLPGLAASPPASELAEVEIVALKPRRVEAVWELTFAATSCRPKTDATGLANSVGSFSQRFEPLPGGTRVIRSSQIDRRWLDTPELRSAGLALAQAEHRALKRRVRFDCSP